MSNKFCRFLTNGARIQSWFGELAAAPCCYLPMIPIDTPEYATTNTQYHSQDKCTGCLYFVRNDITNPNYPPHYAKRIINDCDHTDPVYLELSIDVRCNAACLSCNDSFSSFWMEQNKKFNIKIADDYPDLQDDDAVVDKLFANFRFDHLRVLNFLGGEPMISNTTKHVLKRLVQQNIAPQVDVVITTNGSVSVSDEFASLFKEFRKVTFSLSLDGIESRFEYLRYPLKWQKISRTLDTVQNLPNAKIIVNTTVNPLNIFYMDELTQWLNTHLPSTELHTPLCNGIMSLAALPAESNVYLKTILDNDFLLRALPARTNHQAVQELLTYLNTWDQRRNTNWKLTFPRAVEFMSADRVETKGYL